MKSPLQCSITIQKDMKSTLITITTTQNSKITERAKNQGEDSQGNIIDKIMRIKEGTMMIEGTREEEKWNMKGRITRWRECNTSNREECTSKRGGDTKRKG